MRAYIIDEISPDHIEKIRGFLKTSSIPSNLDQIFWVRVPEEFLSDIQLKHRDCSPHVIAAELGPSWLKVEFFVRTMANIQCACVGYCTPTQREFAINFVDGMVERLEIST